MNARVTGQLHELKFWLHPCSRVLIGPFVCVPSTPSCRVWPSRREDRTGSEWLGMGRAGGCGRWRWLALFTSLSKEQNPEPPPSQTVPLLPPPLGICLAIPVRWRDFRTSRRQVFGLLFFRTEYQKLCVQETVPLAWYMHGRAGRPYYVGEILKWLEVMSTDKGTQSSGLIGRTWKPIRNVLA